VLVGTRADTRQTDPGTFRQSGHRVIVGAAGER
jgi:hypothetical protein